MSGRAYVVTDDQALTGTPGDTVITLQSAVTIRPEVYEIAASHGGTMNDATIQWLVRRFNTDDGTGDALTARPLDSTGPATALSAVQGNHTTEPSSFTMTLLDQYVHLRSFWTWRAAAGRGIILPAVATEGIGITPIAPAAETNLVTATMFYVE